jgi:UPF0716 family protein affecting phage T7 exclusion
MKPMIQTVSEAATNPITALGTAGSVAVAPLFGVDLPVLIQLLTAVYTALLVGHKAWQMFKEWKNGTKDESQK